MSLCKKFGLTPSKQYGQNYLLEESVIEAMLEAAKVSKTDTVVEVGPGFGVLTLPLVERAGQVISFEIEKKIAPYWEALITNRKLANLTMVWGNVLRSFEDQAVATPYKVVANLPYQITSAVIRVFLETPVPPTDIVCMVQKEVAERMCAQPGDMSVLALSVQYYATPSMVQVVPRAAFWPVPAVDSAVIHLKLDKPAIDREVTERFFTLVKWGFAQKRKVLFNNLLPNIGKNRKAELDAIFKQLNLSLTVRAQELSLEQWQAMVNLLG